MTLEELTQRMNEQPTAQFTQTFDLGDVQIIIPVNDSIRPDALDFSRAVIECQGEHIALQDIGAKLFAFLKTLAESEAG